MKIQEYKNIHILISHCYLTCHHNLEACAQKAVLAKMRAAISLELHTQTSTVRHQLFKTKLNTKQTPEKSFRIAIATVKIIAVS